MLLEPTEDQTFFRETTQRYLVDRADPEVVRGLRDDPAGFTDAYWRGGAELGWISLLVGEEAGGGSISGAPVIDLSLIAFEFGRAAAPGPLLPTNLAACALSDAAAAGGAGGEAAELLPALMGGRAIASWADGAPTLTITADGDDLVLNGAVRPVESAPQASHLVVTGATGSGITQVLVPTDAAGVTVTSLRSLDLTRRFSAVQFDGVRVAGSSVLGAVGGAGAAVTRQRQLGIVIVTAEMVGTMQRAFDLTLEWLKDRYSFGRPLASYQALKHRAADMALWLEAGHAVSDGAAAAVQEDAPDAEEILSAAKAYIGEFGSELLQDCVQLHGGIGVTYEHDLHLFMRRHTVDRTLFGPPDHHRQRLAEIAIDAEDVA